MLVHARVTYYIDFIDCRGATFVHSHLEINRVILNIGLNRFDIKEEITLVGI